MGRPALNRRERQASRSLRLLGEQRFLNFIRAVRDDGCVAARLMNDALDEGRTLDSQLFDGDEFGLTLIVVGRAPTFLIKFGCQAGPMAGDGGEWVVEFNADSTVKLIEPGVQWLS